MYTVGIDLSGPRNREDTVLAFFAPGENGASLRLVKSVHGASDSEIVQEITTLLTPDAAPPVIGIDAPLSYNEGGGDRPADADLRRRIVAAGLASGSVMPPTLTRMAYLTLRGVCVARTLGMSLPVPPAVVEVHPGAAMVLRGAPSDAVRSMKTSAPGRRRLLRWLEEEGLKGVTDGSGSSDHYVAACAAALSAWKWNAGNPAWIQPADPPHHPFDYVA